MEEKLMFDPQTHTYTLNGKDLISVTQLLAKHGLSPNYNGVDEDTLKASAERGTLIHKEIEDYIKKGEVGFTKECAEFVSYAREHNLKIVACEVVYHNDIVAGTCDLVIEEDGEYVFGEHKTTSTLHKDSVAWQDTLYAYLSKLPHKDYCYAFHYTDEGLEVTKIALKPLEEAENLIQAEREGKIYKAELEVIDTELAVIYEAEKIIERAKAEKEEAEARKKEVYEAVMKAMKEKGIKTYETDTMRITLKDGYTKTTIDTTRLKKENPLVAKAYEKTSEVAESLVVTLKGD
jgi:predicted peroxiredoxin